MFPPASPHSVCSPNLRYPIVTPETRLPVVALAILENLLNLPRFLQPPLFPIAISTSSAATRLWLSVSAIFACGSSREPPVLLRLAASQAEPLISRHDVFMIPCHLVQQLLFLLLFPLIDDFRSFSRPNSYCCSNSATRHARPTIKQEQPGHPPFGPNLFTSALVMYMRRGCQPRWQLYLFCIFA